MHGRSLRLSVTERNHLSFEDASKISALLTDPLVEDRTLSRPIADELTSRQMGWQASRSNSINQDKLLSALNSHLKLGSAPEYLRLTDEQFQKLRLRVWIDYPDLSTGLERGQVTKGSRIFVSKSLSPYEAYLCGSLLVYQKLFSDEYVKIPHEIREEATRSDAEKMPGFSGRNGGTSEPQALTPGIHFIPPNPRRTEFRAHVSQLQQRWKSSRRRPDEV